MIERKCWAESHRVEHSAQLPRTGIICSDLRIPATVPDFLDLHEVVQTAHGTHPGILIVRFDNDPTRDMTPRHIVSALSRLGAAAVPLESHVYILNHWR
jgi:hypothetical protein